MKPLFYFCFLIFAVVVVLSLSRPMIGTNTWRDAQTFSVARNMVEEGFSIKPRYDLRADGDEVLPGEFPAYNFLVALCMSGFGISFFWGRLTSLILTLITLAIAHRVVKKQLGTDAAQIAVFLLATSSVFSLQSTAIMPEAMMNCLAILAVALATTYTGPLKLGCVCIALTLGALVKPPAFCAAAFIGWIWLMEIKQSPDSSGKGQLWRWIKPLVILIIPLLVTLLWVKYIIQFGTHIYGGGQHVTHEYTRTRETIISQITFKNLYHAIKKTLLHGLGVAGIWGGLWGFFVYALRRQKSKRTLDHKLRVYWIYPCFLWILAHFAILTIAGDVQRDQNYYAAGIAIPCMLLSLVWMRSLQKPILYGLLIIQTLTTLYLWRREVFSDYSRWGQIRQIPTLLDPVSSRSHDRFIFWGQKAYFPLLGQTQRRGITYDKKEDIFKGFSTGEFQFFYADSHVPQQEYLFWREQLGTPILENELFSLFKIAPPKQIP